MDKIPQWKIAKYAVDVYSYLLPTNGTYTAHKLTSLIRSAYKMDARRKEECDAIEGCVVKIVKHFETITATIRRS